MSSSWHFIKSGYLLTLFNAFFFSFFLYSRAIFSSSPTYTWDLIFYQVVQHRVLQCNLSLNYWHFIQKTFHHHHHVSLWFLITYNDHNISKNLLSYFQILLFYIHLHPHICQWVSFLFPIICYLYFSMLCSYLNLLLLISISDSVFHHSQQNLLTPILFCFISRIIPAHCSITTLIILQLILNRYKMTGRSTR